MTVRCPPQMTYKNPIIHDTRLLYIQPRALNTTQNSIRHKVDKTRLLEVRHGSSNFLYRQMACCQACDYCVVLFLPTPSYYNHPSWKPVSQVYMFGFNICIVLSSGKPTSSNRDSDIRKVRKLFTSIKGGK